MTEAILDEIAEKADMIIRGYAFTKEGDFVRIFNLNDGKSSMMINLKGNSVFIPAFICSFNEVVRIVC